MPLSNPSPGGRGLLSPGVPLLDIFINGIVQHVVFRAWSLGLSTKFSVSFHIIACWHLIPKAEECPPCGQTMGAYLPPGQGPPGLSPTGCLEGPLFRKPSLIPSFSSPVSVLTSSPPPTQHCVCVSMRLSSPVPEGGGGALTPGRQGPSSWAGASAPSLPPQQHSNASQSLCDIIRLSREQMSQAQDSPEPDQLLATLEKWVCGGAGLGGHLGPGSRCFTALPGHRVPGRRRSSSS